MYGSSNMGGERFYAIIAVNDDNQVEQPGLWRVRDTLAVYSDSRVMSGADVVATVQWLNEADEDGRLDVGAVDESDVRGSMIKVD